MEPAIPTGSVVTVTESAARQIRHLAGIDPANGGKHLRVFVEQGGCSGMQYSMVFDQERPGDEVVETFGVRVLVDPFSAGKMRGAVVDFSDDLNAGGFKITNPVAHHTCGCGKSFGA